MNIHFQCPECQCPDRQELGASGPSAWQCLQCGHRLELASAATACCAACGNIELYKKKDFPHWLGMTILTVACLAFLGLIAIYHQWWAWVILIGSAAFDGLLYLAVGDVIVCYRCGAHLRGAQPGAEHKPFELAIGERYRQERLRREQIN